MLGHAESIGYHSDLFAPMNKKNKVYRKKARRRRRRRTWTSSVRRSRPDPPASPALARHNETKLVLNDATRIIMERYAPPSVLLDQQFHVVQFNGQTGPYLEPSPGEPSFDILKLAREGLSHGLRTALQTARKTRKTVTQPGLRIRHGAASQEIDIEVIPVVRQGHPYYLVLFQTPTASGNAQEPQAEPHARRKLPPRSRISKLEEELAATREYLQSTIQEIEAANEELQSANEEILSSNEELQSTNEELDTAKEELQSTNEELNTVNDELHARNEELTRVNADLLNLLASVQIAIVIVARDLRVRRFTPMAEKKFNLIPSDIGRPVVADQHDAAVPGAADADHRNDRHRLSRRTHGAGQQGRNVPAAHPAVQDAGQPHRRRGHRALRPGSRKRKIELEIGRWAGIEVARLDLLTSSDLPICDYRLSTYFILNPPSAASRDAPCGRPCSWRRSRARAVSAAAMSFAASAFCTACSEVTAACAAVVASSTFLAAQ